MNKQKQAPEGPEHAARSRPAIVIESDPEGEEPQEGASAQAPNLPAESTQEAQPPAVRSDGTELAMRLLEQVPELDEDPTQAMIMAVLNAPTVEQMQAIFQADHFKDSNERIVTIYDMRRNDSDYDGLLPWYLVLDVVFDGSDSHTALTCGATMAMMQFMWLHLHEMLPARVKIKRKERATRKGFYPMHVELLGVRGNALGGF